ncbi:chaperonin CPN60, mitochondrial-like isoform X5 [Citrus sinensis]|uniref:chaperonin CPN60, mitochondrial-like isoform X5 n=1 Tax=Citrus sinensis TaxID=2711 RepID=UPI002277915B|nr:chaperonin CPN60, mitochondrial-like isoform X5 [Citrus sinensis]
MLRHASNLASKVRLLDNNFQPVHLTRSRQYTAAEVTKRFLECTNSKVKRENFICGRMRKCQTKDKGLEWQLMHLWEIYTAQPITSFEQIALFGTAAANGDRVIGELIAKAFEKGWGNNLHVLADRKTPPSIELQLYWGMTLDRGYLSPYFITNHKTKECVLRDPYIMILEKKVSNCVFFDLLTEIGPVRRYNGTDVLIIAEDIENDLLASLVLNGVATATKACVIKPPGFGESRKASLRDIAKFTYGKVMTGKDFECVSLGHAEKITVSKDQTVILLCKACIGHEKLLQWRFTMENLQDFPEESCTKHSYLAAVIKVCGSNKAEVREKKDRVANAINAVKAAKEGVVSCHFYMPARSWINCKLLTMAEGC